MYCTGSSKGFILCTVQEAVQGLYCVEFILCTVQEARGLYYVLYREKQGVHIMYCTGSSTEFMLCIVQESVRSLYCVLYRKQ